MAKQALSWPKRTLFAAVELSTFPRFARRPVDSRRAGSAGEEQAAQLVGFLECQLDITPVIVRARFRLERRRRDKAESYEVVLSRPSRA